MPKVTVIIPAYNAMQHLPQAFNSILKQTFGDIEVLIINDCSSDSIMEWYYRLAEPRAKLICQAQRKGLAEACNLGVALAKGEYITFLNANELWELNKLEKQVNCLEQNPTLGLVYNWMLLADNYGNKVIKPHQTNYELQHLLGINIIACSSMMVRNHCFDKVGLFKESLDYVKYWDMWIRIGSSYPVAFITEVLAYYRLVANSVFKHNELMGGTLKLGSREWEMESGKNNSVSFLRAIYSGSDRLKG